MELDRNTLLSRIVTSLHSSHKSFINSGIKSKRFSLKASTKGNTNAQPIDTTQKSNTSDFNLSRVDKPVGRNAQLLMLSQCFSRIIAEKSLELVVIHGTSGSGKSYLVQEFRRNLPCEVLHVQGKFDQLYSHAPYSAFVAASDQLCRQIWKAPNCADILDRIRSLLGPDVQFLENLIPTLGQMSKSHYNFIPSSKECNVATSFIRFKQIFRAFLRSVASPENPLVFFLDDLQWADTASLELLKSIIHDSMAQNIMLICSYREGEMSLEFLRQYQLGDESVMIDRSMSSSSSTGRLHCAAITDIHVDCLDVSQLNELISFKLSMNSNATQSLSQLIWKKTDGNPFYALNFLEMLYDSGLLIAENKNTWIWDESQILLMTNVSDNLASILEAKVQRLTEQVRSILQIASFIGHEFPSSILITIVYEEQDTIATDYSFQRHSKQVIQERILSALTIAVDEGLLETTHQDDEFKFAHDKIQEVLYETLMPDEIERQLLHQRIGTLIWDSIKDMAQTEINDWFVFLAADNLNRAINLVDYSGDRLYLVELNLIAGKLAIQKSDFFLAAEYLRIAVDLIMQSARCWDESYDLCLELFNVAAETEKNVGCYTRSKELVDAVHKNAILLHHRSTVFTIEIDILTIQGKIKESVQLGLSVLRNLGVKFPHKFNTLSVVKELLAVKLKLGRRKLQDLIALPEVTDELILLSLSIMNQVAINAFILGDVYKEIYVAVCLRMFRFTLIHGLSKLHSPLAFVVWGSLNAIFGQFDNSLEAETLAFNIIDKYKLESIRGTIIITSYGFNHFWREKLDSSARHEFLNAYRITMSYGQISVAHMGIIAWVVTALYLDDPISKIHPQLMNFINEMREYDSRIALMFLLPLWQVVSVSMTKLM
jgi:predicted ATPase